MTRSPTAGGVKAIVAPGMGGATRKELDELTERAKRSGEGLVWLVVDASGPSAPRSRKFLGADGVERLVAHAGAAPGDLVLVVADDAAITATCSAASGRAGCPSRPGDPDVLSFCWINRFPMYKWDSENDAGPDAQPFSASSRRTRSSGHPRGDPSRCRRRIRRPRPGMQYASP